MLIQEVTPQLQLQITEKSKDMRSWGPLERKGIMNKLSNDISTTNFSTMRADFSLLETIVSKINTSRNGPTIGVFDDDPLFAHAMIRCGKNMDLATRAESSVDEMMRRGFEGVDVAIVDYDLGTMTGDELVKLLKDHSKRQIPILMISSSDRTLDQFMGRWPDNVKGFMLKNSNPKAIIKRAIAIHKNQKNSPNRGIE